MQFYPESVSRYVGYICPIYLRQNIIQSELPTSGPIGAVCAALISLHVLLNAALERLHMCAVVKGFRTAAVHGAHYFQLSPLNLKVQ